VVSTRPVRSSVSATFFRDRSFAFAVTLVGRIEARLVFLLKRPSLQNSAWKTRKSPAPYTNFIQGGFKAVHFICHSSFFLS